MSTTINVTVDSGGLSAQNRQQVGANRQARLEQDRLLNLSAKALDERTAAQAAKGLSLDGQPLYGTPFTAPRPREEPAATRPGGNPAILIAPSEDYGTYGLAVSTKNIKSKIAATSISFGGGYLPPTDINNLPPIYSPTGGPTGSPYLRSAAAPLSNTFEARRLYYMVCDDPDVRGYNFQGGFKILSGDSPIAQTPTQVKTPLHKLKKYTVECYMQAAVGGPIDPSLGFVNAASDVEVAITRNNVADFSLCRIILEYAEEDDGNIYTFFGTFAGLGAFGQQQNQQRIDFGPTTPQPDNINNIPAYVWPTRLEFGSWYHFAYVRDGNTERFYVEGVMTGSGTGDFDYLATEPNLLFGRINCQLFNGGVAVLRPAIQGIRFTPKALYTENFTPPPVINSLA